MNVLFLTLAYPENGDNLYTDLMSEIAAIGHTVFVVCPRERKRRLETELIVENNVHVLRVKTPNITQANVVEKAYATLRLRGIFQKAIDAHYGHVQFDLILFSTPPVTLSKLVDTLKRKYNAKTYLMLKDIFPQNAVDLGMMKKDFIYAYFKRAEKRTYAISDYIGTMSEENKNHLIRENPEISVEKVEICPNGIRPKAYLGPNRSEVRKQYGILENEVLFVYGGNLGKPQGIDFLIRTMSIMNEVDNVRLVIVGSGTEFKRVQEAVILLDSTKVILLEFLPQEKYRELLHASDVGLVFLDPRFTIPNFPSRINDYFEAALPVLAATDVISDLRGLIQEHHLGFWVESGMLEEMKAAIIQLATNTTERIEMGRNSRRVLDEFFTAEIASGIILQHFME